MNKEFKKYKAAFDGETFIIEEELPDVGWYLYKFNSKGIAISDYLQHTLEEAIEFAKEEFGVAPGEWVEVV